MTLNDARLEILNTELRKIRFKTMGYRVLVYLAVAALILTKFHQTPPEEVALTADDVTCRRNLRTLGKSLEGFAATHQGQYPSPTTQTEPLHFLTPELLARLPVCPTNGTPYGARFGPGGQWNDSGSENYYLVWCRGSHPGNSPGFPWVDSLHGLVPTPREIKRPTGKT